VICLLTTHTLLLAGSKPGQVTIIKTNHIFIANNVSEPPVMSDMDIYWLIPEDKSVIRIIGEKSMTEVYLDEIGRSDQKVCGYQTTSYSSEHPDMKDFFIDFFISSEPVNLDFIRLIPKKGDGKVFYISNNDAVIKKWIECNKS
jgi:hypothetical protein